MRGFHTSGLYQIKPSRAPHLDNVYCEMLNGSGWTLLQVEWETFLCLCFAVLSLRAPISLLGMFHPSSQIHVCFCFHCLCILLAQRRQDGTLSFNRGWLEYKYGFGNLYGEFWLGNEMLYYLTSQKNYVLRIDMWDWEGQRAYAEYEHFKVNSETDKYALHVKFYKGNAGKSPVLLHARKGQPKHFSFID